MDLLLAVLRPSEEGPCQLGPALAVVKGLWSCFLFDCSPHLENPQAAYDLIDAIYLGIGDLSSMPERFPAWKREPMKSKGVRFLSVKNFNVFYVIDKKQHMVSVFRVIYNRRDV